MRTTRLPVDKQSVQWATSRSIEFAELEIARALGYLADKERKQRIERCECRYCFYMSSSRLGGAAMTRWECGVCAKEFLAGSTAHPMICAECGWKHELCVECGGDLHQRVRRKWVDIPVVPMKQEGSDD